MKKSYLKTRFEVLVILVLLASILIPFKQLHAASLSGASLELGDPRSTETSNHTFNASGFTTGTAIACLTLELNDAADGGGTAIGTTTGSTFNSSSLLSDGNWAVDNSTNGRLAITNGVTTEAPLANGNVVWGAVVNGATEGVTYYGILNTYTDSSCTGGNEVDSALVAFIYKDGEPVSLEIGPLLTFTCAGVAASAAVNGATTTHLSDASGIDYDKDVTSSVAGVSAHDLQVSTNAPGGYTVYIRQSGSLSNGIENIDPHAGTNTAPTTMSTGTEAWGYTSEDSTLGSGTADRFTNPGNEWAGFSTSDEIVMDNTVPTTGIETTRVGHQVNISGATPSGTYSTTIIYTVVATF